MGFPIVAIEKIPWDELRRIVSDSAHFNKRFFSVSAWSFRRHGSSPRVFAESSAADCENGYNWLIVFTASFVSSNNRLRKQLQYEIGVKEIVSVQIILDFPGESVMASQPYWSENFFANAQIHRQFKRLRERLREAEFESATDLRTIFAAIEQVELDVGRALLKLHALTEVLEEKGLVTGEELAQKADELDGLDGRDDGVLHPVLFRTEEEQNRLLSPRAFLLAAEKTVETPTEFLARLEQTESDAEAEQEEEQDEELPNGDVF